MSLTYNIQEAMEWQQEKEARRRGVNPADIAFSRLTAIAPLDVRTFREYSTKGVLLIVRCPKVTARGWHGHLPPKPISAKEKTGKSGVSVTSKGRMFVSDYDLMSIWRGGGVGWRKVMTSAAHGASRGPYPIEGQTILKELNSKLVSRIMHGCQDDFCSPHNPGVKMDDHFAAFYLGQAIHLRNPPACKTFYTRMRLTWLYGLSGKYLLDVTKQELAET